LAVSCEQPVGLVPHLTVDNAAKAIEFYTQAFGATEVHRMPAEDGRRLMHAQMTIDGSTLYLCDDFPEYRGGKSSSAKALGGTPVVIHRYVPDVDAAVARAARAGATVTMPPTDMFWGDRYAQVADPFGLTWSLATPLTKK
jgi:PhnB protein